MARLDFWLRCGARYSTCAHAVIAVAEGAAQDLLAGEDLGRDVSGNAKPKDIGPFMRERIEAYFKTQSVPIVTLY